MTIWQWRVFKALIRYVLANAHYEFKISYTDEQRKADIDLLAEALRRE